MERLLLLLFNTTRTTSGPPSTRAAIAMDGGVADERETKTTLSAEGEHTGHLASRGFDRTDVRLLS